MRAFVIGVAALAFGATLSACSSEKSAALAAVKTDPAAVEKLVAKLASETFKGKSTAAADVAAVRDALPKEVALTWSGLNFDQASGATVLTAVKLTPADMPDVGLSVDEVRLWDFDADLAKARLGGERLTETAKLASRVELKGAKVFGLETLIGPAMNAYTDAVEDTMAAVSPAAPEMGMRLGAYEFSIGRLVIKDVVLRPYELKLATLPPENDFAEAMPLLQNFAAVTRTFAADTLAMFDLKAEMDMTQMGQAVTIDFNIPTYGVRGMRGSDIDASFMRGMLFSLAMPGGATNPQSGIAMPAMNMSGGLEYVSVQETRLDKLLGYLARGEWPPRTEVDLLSYGLVTAKNQNFAMNGRTFYSISEMVIDARKWHWFIPAKASFKASNIVYDIKVLTEISSEMTTGLQAANPELYYEGATSAPIDPAILEVVARYGLDKPSIDVAFGWDWNANTGATAIDGAFGLDNYFTADMKYEGSLPSFKAVSDLIPDDVEKTDGAAVGAVFEKASTLKLVNIDIVDNGGLQKSFALAADIMKLQASSPDAPNPMANMTADQMRSMSSAAIYLLADQATSQVAAAGPLIRPFAAFIEKGGRVKITSAPKEPVQLGTLSSALSLGQTTPDAAIEQLNIKVEHMPPAGK